MTLTPLEWFLHYEIQYTPLIDIDEWEDAYNKDYSSYTIIDNEEGDFGIVKIYLLNGTHVANWINRGGDSYWYEYTQGGVLYYKNLAKLIFESELDKIKS